MSTGSSLQSAFDGLFRTSYRLVRILALVFAGLFTMGPINAANAGSVTLQWDPVDDPQVTSYEICYGLSSGQYGELCAAANDQGNATNKKTIDGLTAGKTYYFAARSANHTPGVYSTFSNEVSATVPAAPLTTIPVTPATGTIWPSTAVPGLVDGGADNPVELGVKFRSDVSGTITGIRFYKASANTGTHVGNLWSSTGSLLASATFTNETASGWQQVNFASPVPITANTVYVASYHTNVGHYSADVNYFATAGVDNPPLHALANGVSGGNGVYAYGASSAFPTQTWNTANYWVDVVFRP